MSLTFEQTIKAHSGLTWGRQHLVRFILNGRSREALVNIGRRGKVTYLAKPHEGQMYASWQHVKGDISKSIGEVIVWPFHNAEIMGLFKQEFVAVIAVPVPIVHEHNRLNRKVLRSIQSKRKY